jgi:hypothetical protein
MEFSWKDFEEMLAKDFDYRHSAAFGEYEKCLIAPGTVGNAESDSGNCNLTDFIEMEKIKLANKYKFYRELNEADEARGGGLFSPYSQSSTSSAQTMGLFVLAGIFGGVISLVMIFVLILYFNSVNQRRANSSPWPSSVSEFLEHLQTIYRRLVDPATHTSAHPSPPVPSHGSGHHNLQIFHDQELGHGSYGTVVLRGLFEGRRHVAVKKMVARFHNFERFVLFPLFGD